jgi:hypothetical protein
MGWLVIATVLGFFVLPTFPGGEMGYQILYLLVFLLLLIFSAVPGSKAAKLKRQYGIKWSCSSSRQHDKFHQQVLNVVTRTTKDERFKRIKFYVRASHGCQFIGPLTMEEMRNKLMTGELQFADRAIEAVGQTSSKLNRTPAEDWVPLSLSTASLSDPFLLTFGPGSDLAQEPEKSSEYPSESRSVRRCQSPVQATATWKEIHCVSMIGQSAIKAISGLPQSPRDPRDSR